LSAATQSGLEASQVCEPVSRVGEKMKSSAIMPNIVFSGGIPIGHIGCDPFDTRCVNAKAVTGRSERSP
jgi:hypothetical protein